MSEVANILVVDDTPANLTLLGGLLRERGYRVRPAPSGEVALRAAATEPPDLVLLDIDMPGMNGFEVCRRMKADPALADVPILFISALADVSDKVEAFAVGGVDYITKPFQFEEVHRRVATHLELRRQRRELRENNARLRELEALRDELVHMLVHDMRSPLTALITTLGFLKDDLGPHLGTEGAEDIAVAIESARRLAGLANDLLDVSRLEAGQMPLELSECDLGGLAVTATAGVRGLAHNVDVRIEVPAGFLVRCDRGVIGRVIENLVGNALKHSPRPGVVRVSAERLDGGARVVVRDEGPGIPAAYRERIFEKFGMVEARRQQKYHSVGLGLAFCKLAVEAHGGRVGVDSEDGQGSAFWLVLPAPP